MTENEASFILSNIDRRVCDDELNDALDMAIKALEQQSCEDCISRAEAIKETKKLLRGNYDPEYIVETLKMLPPVTPQAKTGRWINLEETKYKGQVLPFWGRYECSKCGGHGEGTFNYCPNCGAKMTESEDKE